MTPFKKKVVLETDLRAVQCVSTAFYNNVYLLGEGSPGGFSTLLFEGRCCCTDAKIGS